ncbi:MAG: general stress protein [Brooklawnia sp.]
MSMNQPRPKSAREALKLKRPISVAIYDEYPDAAHAVDYLSDRAFPVETLAIVGTDLKSIEKVTGQMTWGKILLAGFMQGAMWAGMFAIFWWLTMPQLGLLTILALAFGGFGLVGMAIAAMQYRMRGGDRDYTSTTTIIATHYEVLAESEYADRARHLLSGGEVHRTREVTSQPTPAAPPAGRPNPGVDLASLPTPFGQEPAPGPGPGGQQGPGGPGEYPATGQASGNPQGWGGYAQPVPNQEVADQPQPVASPETAQQPSDPHAWGQYWSEGDAPGIGDVPPSFQRPKRTAEPDDSAQGQ